MNSNIQRNKEALIDDIQNVLADTEALLRDAGDQTGAKADAIRARISAKLAEAKAKLSETEQLVAQKAKVAAKATDQYVHDNPWQSIGIAAGVGFLVGLLVSRR